MLNTILDIIILLVFVVFAIITTIKGNWRQWVWVPKVVTRRFNRGGDRR